MPKHPKIPNSSNARELILSASRTWRGATVQLSWAHERPGTNPGSETTVFEEEILETQVKNCKVTGRRSGEGELALTLHLEVDTDLNFAYGKIAFLVIEKDNGMATVYFRDAIQVSEEVRIELIK